MMRYLSASTMPGVNPPTGSEPDEVRRPTGASMGAAPALRVGSADESVARVGASEGGLTAAPQDRQNRSDGDNSLEQEGHCMTVLRSRLTAIGGMRRRHDH